MNHLNFVVEHGKRHLRRLKDFVSEILIANVVLVVDVNYEVIYSVMGIDLHNLPQNWLTTNFDH